MALDVKQAAVVVLITLAAILFIGGVLQALVADIHAATESLAQRCADAGGVYINLPPLEVGCVGGQK